jgi:hypothetical protein
MKDLLCERAPLALWVYHIETKDHLCERTPLGIFSWKDLLWVYHIEMIDLIWERVPMGYPLLLHYVCYIFVIIVIVFVVEY